MVSMKTVTKSFLKTGITNALDESEDNMLWVGDKNIDVEGASELVPESSYENNCDQWGHNEVGKSRSVATYNNLQKDSKT